MVICSYKYSVVLTTVGFFKEFTGFMWFFLVGDPKVRPNAILLET